VGGRQGGVKEKRWLTAKECSCKEGEPGRKAVVSAGMNLAPFCKKHDSTFLNGQGKTPPKNPN